MKMGRVMRSADLGIHPNDDAEKTAQFRHVKSLRYGGFRRNAERSEYEQYHRRQLEESARVGSDFDRMAKQLTDGRKKP
jgi:hypothetical protein